MNQAQFPSGGLGNGGSFRAMCHACRRPRALCYCPLIAPFASEPRFVILSQPREAKHRLGTGRMAHLCLSNSLLLEGVDFSRDLRVNRELGDSGRFPVLLYPSRNSINLTRQSTAQRAALLGGRGSVVFVLDGTWKSVRKMLRLSGNVASLPAVCFEPPSPSDYRIRRQPRPHCYSTIEAIHHLLDLLTPAAAPACPHHNLLTVFRSVVERQLAFTP
jgi:DTW domain-containing protein YfiP